MASDLEVKFGIREAKSGLNFNFGAAAGAKSSAQIPTAKEDFQRFRILR